MGEWAEWLAEREDQEIANSYTNFDKILDRILKKHRKDKKELRICKTQKEDIHPTGKRLRKE